MIFVQYPPTLTRNYNGKVTQVPSFFTELFIEETNEDVDILESIKNSSVLILKEHKYSSILNFTIYEVDNEIANVHFQIPAYSIMQDSMELDYTPVSYYGTIRFNQTDGSISDLQL